MNKKNEFEYLLSQEGMRLRLIPIEERTDDLCLIAVKQNGMVLQFVRNQTEEICLAAITQNPDAFLCVNVENQTEKVCISAVKQNGMFLSEVVRQTEEICLEAVKQNGISLYFVENQTKEICAAALENTPLSFLYAEPDYYQYHPSHILGCIEDMLINNEIDKKRSGNLIIISPREAFLKKVFSLLSEFSDDELINAVNNDLKELFSENNIKLHPELFQLNQKSALLKVAKELQLSKTQETKKPKII